MQGLSFDEYVELLREFCAKAWNRMDLVNERDIRHAKIGALEHFLAGAEAAGAIEGNNDLTGIISIVRKMVPSACLDNFNTFVEGGAVTDLHPAILEEIERHAPPREKVIEDEE